MRNIILIASFCLLSLLSQGQNYSLYNGYFVNPFIYNPAGAATEHLQVNTSYRRQWVEIPNAPSVGTITANTLLDGTRAGVGIKVSTFSRGFLNTSDVSIAYAYGIPLNLSSKLFFGLAGGVLSNSLNVKDATTLSDPALATISSSLIPSISFGMLYKNSNGFNFGVSLPKLVNSQNLDAKYSFSFSDNMIVSASFSRWNPTPKFVKGKATKSYGRPKKTVSMPLEVFSLYRYSTIYGSIIEATARYNFNKSVWLSGTYRQYQGVIPGVGFNLDNVSLSYFYELGIGGDLPLRTHEVLFTLKLGKEKKYRDSEPVTPISKINGTKPATVVAKVPQKNPAAIKTTPNQPQTALKNPPPTVIKKDPITTTSVTTPTTEVKKDPITTVPVTTTGANLKAKVVQRDTTRTHTARLKQPTMQLGADTVKSTHEQERIELDKHLEEHADGKHDDTHNEPINQRHDFVKRGTHHEELEVGTYVIAGAFQSRENANHYVSNLKALGYKSADFGHLSVRNLWYVFIAENASIPDAKNERDRLQKNKIFSQVWLLTVQE